MDLKIYFGGVVFLERTGQWIDELLYTALSHKAICCPSIRDCDYQKVFDHF